MKEVCNHCQIMCCVNSEGGGRTIYSKAFSRVDKEMASPRSIQECFIYRTEVLGEDFFEVYNEKESKKDL